MKKTIYVLVQYDPDDNHISTEAFHSWKDAVEYARKKKKLDDDLVDELDQYGQCEWDNSDGDYDEILLKLMITTIHPPAPKKKKIIKKLK